MTAGLLELCSSFRRAGGGARSWSFSKERLYLRFPCASCAAGLVLSQNVREKTKMSETEVDLSFLFFIVNGFLCVW